jgi:hypothetical protein
MDPNLFLKLGQDPDSLKKLDPDLYKVDADTKHLLQTSVADPDPGSGAFLTPGSGIRIRDPGWSNGRIRIRDPG